jgi:DNA (cytosine-5)-methyltransferase 1
MSEEPWEDERSSDGYTVGSLFSGIGGMDLGFEQAGYEILWANEIDPHQAAIHKANFPDTHLIEESIHLLSTDDLMDRFGQVDVIVGGFPCVTYSKIAALHGTRHSTAKPQTVYGKYAERGGELFLHYRRFVGDMQPKAFVVENVCDLAGCQIVMETLKNTPCPAVGGKLGRYYNFVYGSVNTMDFGIAQRRKRMFVIGVNKDVQRPVLRKRPLIHTHTVGSLLEENPDETVWRNRDGEIPNYIRRRITGEPSPKTGKPYRDRPSVKEIGPNVMANTCMAHYAMDQSTTLVRRLDGRLTPYSVKEYGNIQGLFDFLIPNERKSYRGIGNAVSVPVARTVGEALLPALA